MYVRKLHVCIIFLARLVTSFTSPLPPTHLLRAAPFFFADVGGIVSQPVKGRKKKDPPARHILFSHESCLGIWQGSACWKIDESGSVFREGFFTRSLTRCSLDGVKDGGIRRRAPAQFWKIPFSHPATNTLGGISRWDCVGVVSTRPTPLPMRYSAHTHTHTLQMIAVLCDFGAHRVAR